MNESSEQIQARFVKAVMHGDPAGTRLLFEQYPELLHEINAPIFSFDAQALVQAAALGNLEMVETLLDLGADINARSKWEAGGFSALHFAVEGERPQHAEMVDLLLSRGAEPDIWAAAGLGHGERLERLIAESPDAVDAPGPDGMRPLHFAQSVEIIDVLLEHGADLEARDVDHNSTALQYAIKDPDKMNCLVNRGAQPDIFVAAALGDVALGQMLLRRQPGCLAAMINDGIFTMGDIYVYRIGYTMRPLQLAAEREFDEFVEAMLPHASPAIQLIHACYQGDESAAHDLRTAHPNVISSMWPNQRKSLCDAAWDNKPDAVRLMIEVGFDINETGTHDSTPIDRASFHGYEDIVRILLNRGADLTLHNEFGGDALCACLAGVVDGWRDDGNYEATARMLLKAGCPIDGQVELDGLLRWMVHEGCVDYARLLLEHGADVSAPGEDDRSALDIAVERADEAMNALLLEFSDESDE